MLYCMADGYQQTYITICILENKRMHDQPIRNPNNDQAIRNPNNDQSIRNPNNDQSIG